MKYNVLSIAFFFFLSNTWINSPKSLLQQYAKKAGRTCHILHDWVMTVTILRNFTLFISSLPLEHNCARSRNLLCTKMQLKHTVLIRVKETFSLKEQHNAYIKIPRIGLATLLCWFDCFIQNKTK